MWTQMEPVDDSQGVERETASPLFLRGETTALYFRFGLVI